MDVMEPSAASVSDGSLFTTSFVTSGVYRGDEGVIFRDTWFLQEPVAMDWHEGVLWVLGRDGRHFVLLDEEGTLLDLVGGPDLDRTHDFVRGADGLLYVTTSWNAKTDGRIQVWDPGSRALVADFAPELELPTGIDQGPDGRLYVADWGDDEIVRYDTDGARDPSFAIPFEAPRGLAAWEDGTLYVASDQGVFAIPPGGEPHPVGPRTPARAVTVIGW